MASRLLQRGLTAGGAATTVTICSWMGERSTARVTSRVASQTVENFVVAKPPPPFLRQQYKAFSTKEAAVPPTAKATSESSKSFVQWYEGHLERSPIKTKSVTGSILWGVGDAVAQLVPQVAFAEEDDSNKKKKKTFEYDIPRTARAVIFGFALHAPTSHVHFNFLEWMTVRAGVTGLGIPVFKAFMEQVCDPVHCINGCVFLFLNKILCRFSVCLLELDFEFHVSWCHGCHARNDTYSNL